MAAIDKVYLNTVTVWFNSESDGTNTMEYESRERERIRVTSLKNRVNGFQIYRDIN
jgi:hypothetical protein